MKDFDYAPTKMIEDYNTSKENNGGTLSKTEDLDIIKMGLVRYNPLTGIKNGSKEHLMSIESLKAIKDRFASDLELVIKFIDECETLKP